MFNSLKNTHYRILHRVKITFRRAFRSCQLFEELVLHSTDVLKKKGIKMISFAGEELRMTPSNVRTGIWEEEPIFIIHTPVVGMVIFLAEAEYIYKKLIADESVVGYQLSQYVVDVCLVDTTCWTGDKTMVFTATFPQFDPDYKNFFIVNWSGFEDFYSANNTKEHEGI